MNFNLSYNVGFDYVKLFPRTTIKAIKPTAITSKHIVYNITVPAFEGKIQKIPVALSSELAKAPVYVELIGNKPEDIYNFSNISQIEVTQSEIILTRWYNIKSNEPMNLSLIFIINKSNILAYSSIEVEVPTTQDFKQIIPISITKAQAISPFYVQLISTDINSEYNYSTINQIEITNSNLIISYLNIKPKTNMKLKLVFKEGGIV